MIAKFFANSRPSVLNFKRFSRSLEQFFLTIGQNNFGNKIPFLAYNTNLNYRNENVMQLCTLCRRYFPGSTCLHMHQKTHHKTRLNDDIILKCSYCSGVFREQSSLEEHVRFFHLEEECLICGAVCLGAFDMYQHISEIHPPFFIQGK